MIPKRSLEVYHVQVVIKWSCTNDIFCKESAWMLIITFSNSILRNPQKQLSNLVHKNTAAYFCNNGEKQYPPDGMVI